MNILIIGNLSDDKFISKTKPILDLPYVNKIYLFRNNGNVFPLNAKVNTPPFLLSINLFNRILKRIFFDFYNFFYFFFLLCLNKIDLVIGIYLYPHGFYGSLLALIFKKPFILILPGSDLKMLIDKRRFYNLFKRANFLGLRGGNSVNKLIDMEFNASKLFILDNVFNINDYNILDNVNKQFDIIVFSILRKGKRINIAFDVIFKLKENFPNIKCLVFGDGEQKNNLEKYSIDLGLSDNIFFKSYNSDIIVETLNSAKLFLLTSDLEGLPMTMVESMSCGLPVVVSNINDIPDVVDHGENGFLVSTDNTNEYVDYCKQLLFDQSKIDTFGANARKKIETLYEKSYSEKAVFETWNKVITKSLNT